MYPGSLTVSADTLVALYVDVIRSLARHGLRRFFLYSAHYGPRHLRVVARIAQAADEAMVETRTWAVLHAENVERLGLGDVSRVLSVAQGRNFPLLTKKLGAGSETPTSTHADGAETSEMLYLAAAQVRAGYRKLGGGSVIALLRGISQWAAAG